MAPVAPRVPLRFWQARARGVFLMVCLWLSGTGVVLSCASDFSPTGLEGRSAEIEFPNAKPPFGRHFDWADRSSTMILRAGFSDETSEYGHGVLGPLLDAKTLNISVSVKGQDGFTCPLGQHLPEFQVFEDIAPRFADVDKDGIPEIIVVRSDADQGASLTIYNRHGERIAATPYIGTRFRWLAPVGAGDLDGDGFVELAYIDRPHLAKTLRIWRYKGGKLTQIATQPGLTNHRIGEDYISGGIRECGDGPEMIVVDASWRHIVSARLQTGQIVVTEIGPFTGQASLRSALDCG